MPSIIIPERTTNVFVKSTNAIFDILSKNISDITGNVVPIDTPANILIVMEVRKMLPNVPRLEIS
jgi:hypothetical protein